MPVFRYRARTRMGKNITGTYEAVDTSEVVLMLKGKDCFPVIIEEKIKGFGETSAGGFFKKVSPRDFAIFCRQFSTIINAGVPIMTSLDILRKQIENTRLRKSVNDLYEEVQKGKDLSQAMAIHGNVFPELFVNMVEAGEISGTLGSVAGRMAVHYEKEYRLNEKVKNALIYPSLIIVVALLVITFLVTIVLPVFVSMFNQTGAVLPLLTRMLIELSSFVRERWLLLVTGLAGLGVITVWYIHTRKGRNYFDALKLKVPIIGKMNKKVFTARFARSLGVLASSGIPLLQGIDITKRIVGNFAMQKSIETVEKDIKGGRGLAGSLEGTEIFPPMLCHMVKIGEDTGTLDYMLEKTADFYEEEVENTMNRMVTLLEPIIIIVMAVVVAFITLSIVVPMLDMMTYVDF